MTALQKQVLTIAAAAAIIAAAIAVFVSDNIGLWVSITVFAALIVIAAISFHAAQNAVNKVEIITEALRNNDFSMRFQDRTNPEIGKFFDDITAIIRSDKMLTKQRESYFSLIVDKVSTGIFAIDKTGSVVLVNESALQLLGLKSLSHINTLDLVEAGLDDAFRSMSAGDVRMFPITIKGNVADISVVKSQIETGGERIDIYMINNVYSVIDRQEVEAWIKLTRVLTHEIMNGIAPVHSLSNSLLLGGYDKDAIDKGLKIISATSESLLKFTESFRKFAAIPVPDKKLNYIMEIIESVKTLTAEMLEDKEFTIDIEPADIIIMSDEGLMRQLFVNLIKNAVEAGASKISVRGRLGENESVEICISDNGSPVPEECVKQIFVPFFTTKTGGSGIGLSVCRRIMNLHDGSMLFIQPAEKPFTKTFKLVFA